ncbi:MULTISPECIES: hypothetical protein [Salimicrobium]|uniref:Uncharacterized protein n=4 Tax=Salimicrobium TaxID=351195 RepID=K2FL87_9BACI|nr:MULTISPECIES: hypothetical protein [Salimicrobium]AKG04759.1 hypothetical protein AAV35_008050 [Salimicrobium jeotgali]EKE31736.1 hypothetical protein MJ3_06343 [Salimicrobium jeotgali]PBB06652.1 hypothetical protein CKW00_03100 [Salimicrobium humidisoli]SDX37663.1 hypothetical protein SAMN04488081_0329 [Salimicrobium album]SIS47160.1 hypothetical protein SAMN05421758_101382 [Salimicrobium salexigens]
MLSFDEKQAILDQFEELKKNEISLGRLNYHYEESLYDKKNVVYHLHPNGNGFVYAGLLDDKETDDRGMVNIRDFSEEALKEIVREAIDSLSMTEAERHPLLEEWENRSGELLVLLKEDDGYNVYGGERLEGSFRSYEEASDFLEQEGFRNI